jgi:mono/diheme cytochrome c family protein
MKSLMRGSVAVMGIVLAFSMLSFADGAETFKSKCAMCHSANGAGDNAMGKAMKLRDLGSADVQAQSDKQLTDIITNGKEKMPKFDGKLSADQITEVVKFIRTLKH